jgi:hypothetical protein
MAIGVAVAVTLLLLNGGDTSLPPLHANVLRDSALKLYEIETVRYHVSVEAETGTCFTDSFLIQPDPEQLAAEGPWLFNLFLKTPTPESSPNATAEGVPAPLATPTMRISPESPGLWRATGPTLIEVGGQFYSAKPTYGCLGPGHRHVEERGVYDLRTESFQAESRSTGQAIFPVSPEDVDRYQSERIYVDGKLFARQANGAWRWIPTDYVWRPYVFEGGGGEAPIGDIEQMMASYGDIEIIGPEEMNGVVTTHYRGKRKNFLGVETVDAWIGVDDGLPYRVEIVGVAGGDDSGAADAKPGVTWQGLENSRYPIPSSIGTPTPLPSTMYSAGKVLYEYTYEFSEFNEPVSIVPPLQ